MAHRCYRDRYGGRVSPGFTLLELLVAMFLAALLLTILVKVTALGYRVSHEEIERGSLEAKAMLTFRKLKGDLLATAPAGVTLSDDGDKLVTHPIKEVLTSGRVTFEDHFVYWSYQPGPDDSGGRLTRTEVLERPDGSPFDFSPYRWSPEQLAALTPGSGAKTSLVVDGVTLFSVTSSSEVELPSVGSLLNYELALELPIATTRRSVQLSGTCQIRSGGV